MSQKSADANPNRRLLGCKCKLCHRRAGVTEPAFRRAKEDLEAPLFPAAGWYDWLEAQREILE